MNIAKYCRHHCSETVFLLSCLDLSLLNTRQGAWSYYNIIYHVLLISMEALLFFKWNGGGLDGGYNGGIREELGGGGGKGNYGHDVK